MAAGPYERVIVVGGESGSGSQPINVQVDVTAGPVEVEVVNDQPIEVTLNTVEEGLVINANSNGQSTQNYFLDTDGTTSLPVKTAFGAPAGSGQNTIVAAVTSKKIRVIGYMLQGTGTVSAKFRTGASTDISMLHDFQAREGFVAPITRDGFYFETTSGAALTINLSTAVGVNVQVWYIEVTP